jgi:WD40 repeat protein/predicted Ser/Thr protein kinase
MGKPLGAAGIAIAQLPQNAGEDGEETTGCSEWESREEVEKTNLKFISSSCLYGHKRVFPPSIANNSIRYSYGRDKSLSLGELPSVTYCLNPQCPEPENQPNSKARTCPHCGSDLLINGRYRIVKPLGSGGFGKTFEAEENGTFKVIKVLYKNHPKAVSLFQQEAKVLARLQHPGVPKVDSNGYFTFPPKGSDEVLHCLVMEKIDGMNLMEWLKRRNHQPIDQAQAVEWLKQLIDILGQVHQQHYFHRDIKPHNIMRRPSGQLALIDFGTAREVTGTYLNKVGGGQNVTEIISAGYTPPEQINGKAVPQSDFYALGRTFVYLLTGKKPTEFPEHPRTGKLLWREGAPQICNELAGVIDYMMAPFPGNRPQHTRMILQSLQDVEPALTTSGRSGNSNGSMSGLSGTIDRSGDNTLDPGLRSKGSELRSRTLASRPSTSRFKSKSWPAALWGTLQDIWAKPFVPWVTGGLVLTLALTQVYGAWRYSQIPINPIKVIAELPSSQHLQRTLRQQGSVLAIALSVDGTAASGSFGTIRLWESSTGKLIRTFDKAHQKGVTAIAIGPDGKTLYSGSDDLTIRLWQIETGARRLTLTGHRGSVNALAIDPNGKILASGSADKTIRLWRAADGKPIQTLSGHQSAVNAVAISPNGQILASAGEDKTIRLWNLKGGKAIRTLTGHQGAVLALAFSPDGKMLASASADNTVMLWNLGTGKVHRILTAHRKWVRAVAFSPDGQHLMSGGETLHVWQAATGKLQLSLDGHDSWIDSIAISRNSQMLISGSHDGTLKIWRIP